MSVCNYLKMLFCKHYHVVIEDKFNDAGKRQLNSLEYFSMKSKCKLCDHILEHD